MGDRGRRVKSVDMVGLRNAVACALLACCLYACGGGSVVGAANDGVGSLKAIDHVVIIIQENRSFDNLFRGYSGADTASYGYDSKGDKVTLKPIGFKTTWDLEHSLAAFLTSCNGRGTYPGTDCRMNGFDMEGHECGQSGPPCPIKYPQYAYVPRNETKPYFAMASQYVLADHMFTSNLDESSFISHQYIIAAQASSTVNVPEGGPWGCSGIATIATITQERALGPLTSACLNNQTLGDELDAAGISWKYYTASLNGGDGALWSAYQAIEHIYDGPDWKKNVISPQTRFFRDVRNGQLPAVSWITPTCANSDHAGCDSDTGPQWVGSLVNAVGESRYWKSTAIFIFWDDPGGWYDHVPPTKLDYDGLGFRVPLLVISPYAKQGYVSHVHYEHGSLLRFVEDRFNLSALSASDARATSPEADCFDFRQSPRTFVPIQTTMDERDFERQPLDLRPVDKE